MRDTLSKITNRNGQMAIFVALIFQVLFIFFAMAINVALVVHDKINLQNAADLAAYYAAGKQAEILDAIAHTNYQIRQAWKLLNFRYYYLGNMSRDAVTGNSSSTQVCPLSVQQVPPSETDLWASITRDGSPPPLCVIYPLWSQVNDNGCHCADFQFPNAPVPTFSVPFLPFTEAYQAFAQQINTQIAQTCDSYAAYNWWYAATIFVSYALEAQERMKLIHALANNLAQPIDQTQSSMVDIMDPAILANQPPGSVYTGVYKTLIKNLTSTNLTGFQAEGPQGLQVFNSLQGVPPSIWLPDIDVFFTLFYQNFIGSSGSCSSQGNEQAIYTLPTGPTAQTQLNSTFGPANVQELLHEVQALTEPSVATSGTNGLYLGVEKNPWYWAYVAVQAKSKPRELFFPFFHRAVELTATAYAMPFGGTIGPWYGQTWTQPTGGGSGTGAQSGSDGPPLQLEPQRLASGGMMNSRLPKDLVPNYSRFPGDQLGASSALWNESMQGLSFNMGPYRASFNDYLDVDNFGAGQDNDGLAWPYQIPGASTNMPQQTSMIRPYEVAAVAPDLFDITYYSIQPNFPQRYLPYLVSGMKYLNSPTPLAPFADMGQRPSVVPEFSVIDQIKVANGQENVMGTTGSTGGPVPANSPVYSPMAFWHVVAPQHVLTSWVGDAAYGNYPPDPMSSAGQSRLGSCGIPNSLMGNGSYSSTLSQAAPGACIEEGGRSGYSVKLVSKQMLTSSNIPIGGAGTGSIQNQPPW